MVEPKAPESSDDSRTREPCGPLERDRSRQQTEDLSRWVGRRARRKLRARRSGHRPVWFGLGLFGLIGWSVAIPAVVGVAIGRWIDDRWPGPISWTLTLLIAGVGLGCLNAWYWTQQESRRE